MPGRALDAVSMSIIILSSLVCIAAARAVDFQIPSSHDEATFTRRNDHHIAREAAPTCGGIPSLNQCGLGFPADFCCSTGMTCMQLNSTSQVTAAICCPVGSDCSAIEPFPCDVNVQNATLWPNSEYHSAPPTSLGSCGNECCPLGYSCLNNICYLAGASQTNHTTTGGIGATPTAQGSTATNTGTPVSLTVGTTAPTGTSMTTATEAAASMSSGGGSSSGFSGSAFAAGFVPGLLLGALFLAAILFFLHLRRRQTGSNLLVEKPSGSRDTLTDLRPNFPRPTFHGRTISEPTVSLEHEVYRTAFLHATPPQKAAIPHVATPDVPKPLFSRSPFLSQNEPKTPVPAQSPIPWHLKRGTLSFSISPVRALRKQRSIHSLRRLVSDGEEAVVEDTSGSLRRGDMRQTDSTGTINVVMRTPDQRVHQAIETPHSDGDSWEDDSTTFNEVHANTRDRPDMTRPTTSSSDLPAHEINPGVLGTPYTPSNYGPQSGVFPPAGYDDRYSRGSPSARQHDSLQVPGLGRSGSKRDTTFSALMERAGVGKSDLVPKVPPIPAYISVVKGKGVR